MDKKKYNTLIENHILEFRNIFLRSRNKTLESLPIEKKKIVLEMLTWCQEISDTDYKEEVS